MTNGKESFIDKKIQEDLSPTRNLSGLHLKIVAAIAIIWSLFQLWYASPFPFMFGVGLFKGLPARAIHLGFALLLAFLIFPLNKKRENRYYRCGSCMPGIFCLHLYLFFYDQIVDRGGILLNLDLNFLGKEGCTN